MDLSIRIRLLGLTTVLSIAAMWILTLSLFFVVQAHVTPAVPSESSVVTTYGAPVARAVLANGLSAEALSSPAPSISLTTCDTGDLIGAIRTANVSGGGTVSLQAGCTYALTGFDNTDPTYGSNGLPVITGTITIDGNGATITRTNSAPGFRILQVNPGAVLNLNGIVVGGGDVNGPGGGIRNRGTLSITNSTISGNRANANGGGVFNESGTMSVTGSTFSNNLTVTPGNGGGIYNYSGTLDVTNSTFTSNTAPSASAYGGGILNYRGATTVILSTFSGNSARYGGALSAFGNTDLISNTLSTNSAGWGGAVFVAENWVVNVTGSSMSNNSSGWGGGGAIYNHGGGTINVVRSALAGNSTSGSGGVVYNELGTIGLIASTSWGNSATGEGGVIANYDQATVTNSTLYTNTAAKGGGIASGLSRSRVMVTNSTLSGNSASTYAGGIYNYGGPITITNSIIANSVTGGNCSGSVIDGGYNLDSADSCGFGPANQSVTNADAKLTPLADNGGGIPTMALLAGSPAIDAAGDAVCPATDQRGASRSQDGNGDGSARCDIGAYERAVPDALLASGGSGQTASISSLFGQPLQATARDSLGSSLDGLTVTFSSPVVGASGVLAEGSNVFTANTSASGVATTTLRANSIAGSYVVTTSVGAISSTYSLTNTAPATVDLASSANPSAFGHPVALTATVTSAGGTPTGSVTFVDAASTLGSSALSGGVATLVTSSLAPGNHSITASYAGSPYFDNATSSVLTQTVNLEPAVGDYRTFLPAVMRIYDEGR